MTAHPLPFDSKRLLHLDAGADDVKVLDWFIVWLAPALTRPLVPPDRQAVDSVLTVRVDAHAVANWQRTAADQCRDDGLVDVGYEIANAAAEQREYEQARLASLLE